jgi:hypothetical protein
VNRTFNRRMPLRGLGGAVVAVPFLSSLAGRATRAQSSTGPRRLIVYFTHYGAARQLRPRKRAGALAINGSHRRMGA